MNDRVRKWITASEIYLDRRMATILCLGFSSGLPLLLTFSTLSIWLKDSGISKTEIGLFALVGLPYSIKFLWAPVIDAVRLPLLTNWLGRRRSWALLTQMALVISIFGLGYSDPLADPWGTAFWALIVSCASASQDVVIDAYRVEILEKHQFGAGAAVSVAGYRIGMLASGAGALFLAENMNWVYAYTIMSLLMVIGIGAILISQEPPPPPPQVEKIKIGISRNPLRKWLADTIMAPLIDFLRRPGWVTILLFIVMYKFGDSLAGIMANPFYMELGFTKGEIASVSKIFGLFATLIGGFIGGLLVARIGIMQSLLYCGLLQLLSNLMFVVQAQVGYSVVMLSFTIAAENVSGGMGTAAFVAYLSALCNLSYTATQYALLSSFMSFARTFMASPGGWLADELSWTLFFLLTTIAALPGLYLWWRLKTKTFEYGNPQKR